MSKKLYGDQDINDLVETDLNSQEEFYKGGVGSGIKGHKTAAKPHSGKYGFHTHGNFDPEADKKNRAESDAKFGQALVNEYVNKYKMKHPEGMRSQDAQAWFEGAGLKPDEVKSAMSQIEKLKSQKEESKTVDTKADSNKLKDLFGKPADVFTGAGGKKTISLAVSARNWSESQVKASIPKEMSEMYNVEIKTQVANGAKSIFINLKQK